MYFNLTGISRCFGVLTELSKIMTDLTVNNSTFCMIPTYEIVFDKKCESM